METSKLAIQSGSLSLSAEGSETFVRDALAFWEKLLGNPPANMSAPSKAEVGAIGTVAAPVTASTVAKASGGGLEEFENVFDTVDDKLKIIAHVPGKNKAEQTRNVALIVLFGHLLQGLEQVPSEAIRQACIDQGCFDSANFAQYLKSLKSRVVMNTKAGGGYDVKLTAPGRKDAKEFVQALNGDSA